MYRQRETIDAVEMGNILDGPRRMPAYEVIGYVLPRMLRLVVGCAENVMTCRTGSRTLLIMTAQRDTNIVYKQVEQCHLGLFPTITHIKSQTN